MRLPSRSAVTFTDHAGVRLGYRVSGDLHQQYPVLLIHGMAGDHSTWRALAGQLRRRGNAVISVDLRGHGRSGRASYSLNDLRDDAAHVLRSLGVQRCDVIAHSLGAQVAVRLAMSHPELVRRLVLEEIPPMPRDAADLAENIQPRSSWREKVTGTVALVGNPFPLLRFSRQHVAGAVAEFEAADPQWWTALADITVPTLVVSGGPSSFLPPHHLQAVAAALGDGSFVSIPVGHSVHRDARTEFNSVATAFLSQQ